MVQRPSGSLGGFLYDGFNALWSGSGEVLEQFNVPVGFSLIPLGFGSLVLDRIGI